MPQTPYTVYRQLIERVGVCSCMRAMFYSHLPKEDAHDVDFYLLWVLEAVGWAWYGWMMK